MFDVWYYQCNSDRRYPLHYHCRKISWRVQRLVRIFHRILCHNEPELLHSIGRSYSRRSWVCQVLVTSDIPLRLQPCKPTNRPPPKVLSGSSNMYICLCRITQLYCWPNIKNYRLNSYLILVWEIWSWCRSIVSSQLSPSCKKSSYYRLTLSPGYGACTISM